MKRNNVTNGNVTGKPQKGRGCLTTVLIVFALAALFTIFVVQKADKAGQQQAVDALLEVEQFSRITEAQLVELLGEPDEKEDWQNRVSDNSGYNMTTYRYVDGDVCYEYDFTTNTAGEKPLVYMIIHFDYNGEGSNLGVGLDTAIFDRLGIAPRKTVNIEADTGTAIRWSDVSEKVYEVWPQEVTGDDMVDWVKVKFDPNFPL